MHLTMRLVEQLTNAQVSTVNAPLRKEIARNLTKAEGLRKELLAFTGAKKPKLAKITRAPL